MMLLYAMMVSIVSGTLTASGMTDGGISWTATSCGGIQLTDAVAVDAAFARDLPPGIFGNTLRVDVSAREKISDRTFRSLDALGQFVARVPMPETHRAAVETCLDSLLAERAELATPGASIETLELRLGNLVDRLDGLTDALSGALSDGSSSVEDEGSMVAAMALAEASRGFLDGLRYVAGRVRLYARGTLRSECAMLLWQAAEAVCDGHTASAVASLEHLRRLVTRTSPVTFQRSRLDSVVSKVDSLLGDGRRVERSFDFGGSGTLDVLGLLVDWDGRVTREMGSVPTGKSTELAWEAASEAVVSAVEMEAAADVRVVIHDDTAARDGDATSSSATVKAAFTVEGVDVTVGANLERQRYPFQGDREIPASRAEEAGDGVRNLRADVVHLGLPAAARNRLTSPLDKAELALREGRGADAVTALGQFRDQVWKEAFGGTVAEEMAVVLVEGVEELIPQRQEITWSVPASVSGVLGGWDGVADIKWEGFSAPCDSLVERTEHAVALSAVHEGESVGVSLCAETRRVGYPRDVAKGYRQSHLAWRGFDLEREGLEIEAGVEWTLATYALDERKDKCDMDVSLDFAFAGGPCEGSLSASWSDVDYPNDPERDERTGAWKITGKMTGAKGALTLAWASEWKAVGSGYESEESARAELNETFGSMEWQFAAQAIRTEEAGENGAQRWVFSWEVGMSVDL